jgi:hypothetical protein
MRTSKDASMKTQLKCALLAAVLAAGLSGCTTLEMKGTPFYTGEYGIRKGHAEDRVNVWPLLYYREPALSIAWPFIEKTEEHFALRPVFSVYGTDDPDRVYNLLWPFGQFNFKNHQHRIFPAFWGNDYACVFPLYWHFGHPLGTKGGVDTLLPLWWYDRDSSGYNAWFAGPFFHFRNRDHETGWHLGPLVGNYEEGPDYYRFLLWPLCQQWSRDRDAEHGSAVLPLYWSSRDRAGSRFLSLLYSGGSNSAGDDRWNLLLPLFYNRQNGDARTVATLLGGYRADRNRSAWVALPALSGGSRTANSGDLWALGPIAHRGWGPGRSSSHIVPLYYREKTADDSLFVSLPWSARKSADTSWELLPPVYYHHRSKAGEARVSLLYAQGRSEKDHSEWSTLVPLYYRSKSPDESLLATLLGGYSTDAEGRHWLIYPLLSWGSRSANARDLWLVAPFFHSRSVQGKVTQQHLLPLYYRNRETDTLLSPLFAHWKNDGESTTTLVPPLLSFYSSAPQAHDLWALAGLAHFSWGKEAQSDHVLPLYYRNSRSGTFVSAAFMRWGDDKSRTTVFPPALSWKTEQPRRSDLWLLGPLAHLSWGEDAATSHVLPLYYSDRRSDLFASLLYTSWTEGAATHRVIPPLLSAYTREGNKRELYALLGMFYQQWGRSDSEGHLIPLYYYDSEKTFLTPLFGWKKTGDSQYTYPATPLLGFWGGRKTGGWLFPLFSYRGDKDGTDYGGNFLWGWYGRRGETYRSGMFPLYGYQRDGAAPAKDAPATPGSYGKRFWSLPICWYRNKVDITRPAGGGSCVRTERTSNGCFPLWSYSSEPLPSGKGNETSGSLLLLLYDYMRTVTPKASAPDEKDVCVRTRVLWRLWHYERVNNDVSVDVFPAITYDRQGTTLRKASFLWRLFRYERGPDGRKVDLLFLPVVRQKGKAP